MAKKLGVKKIPANMKVNGIGESSSKIKWKFSAFVRSRQSDFGKSIEFLELEKITGKVPQKSFKTKKWNIPSRICLADPQFNEPGDID